MTDYTYLGKISYGIYVIHPLLIFIGNRILGPMLSRSEWTQNHGGGFAIIFISVTGLTILIAGLSYKYFEMPFLRMKDKFSVVKSTNKA